ncbi:uncharacterized protein LOC106161121 [Lingula anatina]|uniref:Uncharacterized protein LOC106161121 n=1 Tax=Lingula anatina TaxID=7574 RepID=A0A1S3I5D8_LINAN|nr:uncharacterized protein LOC106161121 [Lingula anatina]|eukprot:XP_013393438.1 uncharacterized protein LOC106161121 [Lingula anatina]
MAAAQIFPFEIPRNEKENYFRMHLLLEHATDVLRDVLRTQLQAAYPGLFDPIKTDKLFDILDKQQVKHSLLLLKKRKVINSSQMKLLYPSGNPSTTVTTQDLDITLAVVFLRNITNLNPRATWENPPASDTSIEANIGRVKTYRNRLSHGHHLGITDTAFQTEFDALKQVLLSLSPIYSSDDYDKLLIVPLDAKVAPCQLLSVQLPGKLADLKGREELVQRIKQHIAGETRLVLLTGMGGIGKTSVAIEVGHQEQNVLYFDMRQATNLESVKLALVQHYHPTRSLKDLYSDYQNILIQTLSSLTSDTVIIFDNNDEVIKSNLQDFHSLLQNVLNSSKHITLLCTSREAFSLLSHNMAVAEVPHLDKASSIDILWEGKPTSPTDSESLVLGEIAEKCGGNPLALKLLAVQLKKKTAQRVLDRMKNKNVIESLKVANLPASQEMMACLDMSYETLNTEEQKVFRALHIFPISFTLEEVSEMLEIDEDECESILDSLCNKSLLSSDPRFYDLHPLLRSYAAFRAGTHQNEISRILNAYCKLYMKQMPDLVLECDISSSKETYEKVKKILPHFKVIARWLSEELHDKKTALLQGSLFLIACIFQSVFLYPEALTILQMLELRDEKYFLFEGIGPIIYVKIGEVLQGMGNYKEALTYYERYLKILKEIFGEKHPCVAEVYINIGGVLKSMGHYTEALKYYEKNLEVLGEEHPDIATTYLNIGNVLCAMGKYAEALTYYEKCLETQKKKVGEKHPAIGWTYSNIGSALRDMGKYTEALTYYEKFLEITKEILGEKHPGTCRAYHNIGNVLCDMGKYPEALTYYKKYLEIMKEIPVVGEENPDNGTTYQNIGVAHCGMGKYAEALAYFQKSLEIRKAIFSEKSSETAETYIFIGTALEHMDKDLEALTYYEKCLEIQKEILGEKHPDTAKAYQHIGSALCKMGRYPEALPCYETSLKIIKEKFGEKHLATAKIYRDIGRAQYLMGKGPEALPYCRKSLKIIKEMYGDKHPDAGETYLYIGNALYHMGMYAEALTYYEKSLEIFKEIFGQKHPDTAASYLKVGQTLNRMGKHFEALSCYTKSHEIYEEHFGPNHDQTKTLDNRVCVIKKFLLNKVLMNMSKYLASELIVKREFHQASQILGFIGWDFNFYYKF